MKTFTDLDSLLIILLMTLKILQLQSLRPIPLMQVHQHRLLQLRLSIIYRYRVIVSVQAVDEGLNRRLVNVSDVGCRLTRLLAGEEHVRVDKTESIYDDFSFDRLNWVDYNSH